jgi:uncharacterized iron-regulated protein
VPKPTRTLAVLALGLALTLPGHADPRTEPAALTAPAVTPAPAGTKPASDEVIDTHTEVVDLATLGDLPGLIDKLAGRRAIFLGESHDHYEDHLNQRAIIQGLRAKGENLAIGMEAFQQPYQQVLDDYIAGHIGEAELLRRTDYFDRWRFDYRLYRPILRLAREQGIPVIALNIEREITEAVGDGGLGALSQAQKERIPADMDQGDAAYRERIKAAFDAHPPVHGAEADGAKDDPDAAAARFERFLAVQVLWDEGMAERAAAYLRDNPGNTLVVLAGAGHLEYGQGIPKRVARRIQVPAAVVLNGTQRDLDPDVADFLLYPRRVTLPTAGLLGVLLDTESKGEGVAVKGFAEESGAKTAGMEEGDRIVRVGEVPIRGYADLRIALLDSRPGQQMPVEVLRKPMLGDPERLDMQVELH